MTFQEWLSNLLHDARDHDSRRRVERIPPHSLHYLYREGVDPTVDSILEYHGQVAA